MAIENENGELISYQCSDLIEEIKRDIAEFGGDTVVKVICKEYKGVIVLVNYDFILNNSFIEKVLDSTLDDGEFSRTMTMTAALTMMEQQNSLV